MIPEKMLLDFLSERLTVPVMMEFHRQMPDKFVILERVGSSVTDMIHHVSFAIRSHAPTLYGACELNEQVKSAMDDLIQLDTVSKVELDSDYNYTDTTRKIYRYQAVYDLVLF